MKIIVVSDNHGKECLDLILELNNSANMFIHCGDSEQEPTFLKKYISVRGNNDFYNYDIEKVIQVMNHKILIVHGHHYVYANQREELVNKAKKEGCDIVFFGHTHIFENKVIDGIRIINPGSLNYNRDGSKPCYAEVTIDENNVIVRKVYL